MEPEARFLVALESVSAGAARLDLDAIQQAFSAAFPQLDGSPDRRTKLRAALDALAENKTLRLPSDRRNSWQYQPLPALPLRATLIRRVEAKADRLDHRRFPWVRELGFVAGLPFLHTPKEALQLHEFFKNGGARSPVVPTKERSWQIFGEEKRLDGLQRGELFGEGRLTLAALRCRNVTQILPFAHGPHAANGAPVLIVENECTFHSFSRLNGVCGLYSGVVFGHGDTVLKAVGFLRDLARALAVEVFDYFGDLDPRGLRIGRDLTMSMGARGLKVVPAERLYMELLRTPPGKPQPVNADPLSIAWLPTILQGPVRERFSHHGRIAQEALGWERLCVLHAADPNADFDLGFVPPPKCLVPTLGEAGPR